MEVQRQFPAEAVDPADVAIAVEEGRRRRRRTWLVTAALVSSLFSYFLSPGLFMFLEKRGMVSAEAKTVLIVLCWPIRVAYQNIPIVKFLYDIYIELIGVNP